MSAENVIEPERHAENVCCPHCGGPAVFEFGQWFCNTDPPPSPLCGSFDPDQIADDERPYTDEHGETWVSKRAKDMSDLRNLRRLVARLLADTRVAGDGGYILQFGPVTYGHMARLAAHSDGKASAKNRGSTDNDGKEER